MLKSSTMRSGRVLTEWIRMLALSDASGRRPQLKSRGEHIRGCRPYASGPDMALARSDAEGHGGSGGKPRTSRTGPNERLCAGTHQAG